MAYDSSQLYDTQQFSYDGTDTSVVRYGWAGIPKRPNRIKTMSVLFRIFFFVVLLLK